MTDVRDVGDWRSPTISISTADVPPLPASGIVTCSVLRGDDTVIASVVMTAGAPTATATPWTGALYELTVPGMWVERFVITGDGKGKARQEFFVLPDPAEAPSASRTYATTTDYANAIHEAPETGTNLRRVLRVASARVDEMTMTAIFATDSVTELPTDAAVAVALRDATVLQAAYQCEIGDPYGLSTADEYQSVTAGGITLTRGQGQGGASSTSGRWSAEAYEKLRAAGLTGTSPLPVGSAWWTV